MQMPQHSAGSWNNKLRALRQEFEDKARHKAVSPREADKDVVQPDVPADTESAGAGPSTPQVNHILHSNMSRLHHTDNHLCRSITLIPHFGGVPPVMNTFPASTVRSIYCSTKSKEYLSM